MDDLDLTVAVRAGSDADGRDAQPLGIRAASGVGMPSSTRLNAPAASSYRVLEQPGRHRRGPSLDLEAAELVVRLRRQPMCPITGIPAATIRRTPLGNLGAASSFTPRPALLASAAPRWRPPAPARPGSS